MHASLKDIANALNLSTTTVSWVLSGKSEEKGITPATRDRVKECARELNYRPNLLARSLHDGCSNTIGLIVPSIGDQFYSSMVRFIELEAEKFGYALMVCSSENDRERENNIVDILRAKQVDGLLMAPTKYSNEKIVSMMEDNFPFVLFDRYFPELATNYVIIDNEIASYNLVKHLLEKCYNKIAVLTTNTHLYTMQLRYGGYCSAHEDMGLKPDERLYGEVDPKDYENSIETVLDRIFRDVPDVDAFFFTTHVLASRFFGYCTRKGINLDFGYACIHEEKLFNILAPHMNVAQLPIASLGREAVRILLQDIKRLKIKKKKTDPPPKQGVILSCSLEFRD